LIVGWLLGELVVQYDSSAAADKRCWLLGELVLQYELRRDVSYDRIGWLLTRAAVCWLINKGRASCERSYLIRVRGLLRRGFMENRGRQGVLRRGGFGECAWREASWTQRTAEFGLVHLERKRSASERRLRRVRLERGFVDTEDDVFAEFGLVVRLERTTEASSDANCRRHKMLKPSKSL
jgi:hypothetical protein